MKKSILLTLSVAAVLALPVWAADPPAPTPTPRATPAVTPTPKPTPADAENTGRNQRDRQPGALVPTDQSNRAEDIKVTQDIRKAVMADSALSVNAKNSKIITTETSVALRGPVDSEAEKSKIGEYAKASAGSRQVMNELEVRAKK